MVSIAKIDKDVLNLIKSKYKDKGCDVFVRPKRLEKELPHDIYQIGRSCKKLMRKTPPILEKVNLHKSPAVYRTRFGDLK